MKIVFDIREKVFSVTDELGPFGGVIEFGFKDGEGLPVDLLPVIRYGFSVGNSIVRMPKEGALKSSMQNIVSKHSVKLKPDEEHDLYFFVEIDGVGKIGGSYSFRTPKPRSPYPSWTWNEESKRYNAPKLKPCEGQRWNEIALEWEPDPMEAKTILENTDAITGARLAEDILNALISKGTLSLSDIPQSTVTRIQNRLEQRTVLSGD